MARPARPRPPAAGAGRGPLHQLFSQDHDRLDALLQRAIAGEGPIDLEPFGRFRAGLLRHIGMEEKLLLPAARYARGGKPLEAAEQLRVEHGAIAALLVPTPTRALVALLVSLLAPHNRSEEDPGGVYDTCDDALGAAGAAWLIEELRSFPEPPLKPYADGPEVFRHIEVNFARAGRPLAAPLRA